MSGVIVVDVICPSTSRSYDYKLPSKMKAADIKKRIIEDIRTYENIPELFKNEEKVGIFGETAKLIPDDMSLEEAGIKSGSRIMII